jgi:small-conductance mechanosensitive channel
MKEQLDSVRGILDKLSIVLQEYWLQFLIMLPRIAFAIILLFLIVFIANKAVFLFKRRLSRKAHDPLFSNFVTKLIKYAVIICGVILALHIIGLTGIAGGLLASAGVSAIIFGFAFRDIAENFLAGIILAFDRPFAMGDTVRIGDFAGHVTALSFRTTRITYKSYKGWFNTIGVCCWYSL